jgi:L-lactate dehydrogenase complex protein LldG
MKKEELLDKLRKNTHVQYDMPEMNIHGIQYEDTLQQFVEMTQSVGARVIDDAPKGSDLNDLVRLAYPDAEVFASNLPEIDVEMLKANACGECNPEKVEVRNPDSVAEANELNGVEVGIVRGPVGVAENGCVWIPQTMKEKAMLFISEYLVIFLDKKNIVDNMHQAYERIAMHPQYNFGTFISGPSKTADIEQALVMGAQAARGVTVVLVDE